MMQARVLTEEERWGRPYYSHLLGATIRARVMCQARPYGRCVDGATVALGRRKLCRTHLRIALLKGS